MILRKITLIVCISLVPLLWLNLKAQNNFRFHTFSPKGGFYYDGVKSIVQDRDGFMWVLMDNSIQRFDGYEYKQYYSIFNSLDPNNPCLFHQIATDTLGILHVATNNGLFVYNRIKDSFTKLRSEQIGNLTIDKQNNIWLTNKGVLHKYTTRTDTIECVFYEGKEVKNIAHFEVDKEAVYMATLYDKIYYHNGKSAINELTLFYKFAYGDRINNIKKLGDKLWVLLNNSIICKIDINSKKIEDRYTLPTKYNGKDILAKNIHIDKKENVWIATQQGLFVLNIRTRKYEVYKHSRKDNFSLPNNSIWTIAEDTQQNIWVGTFAGGLCYVNLDESAWVKSYTIDQTLLTQDLISCFAETETELWIGTEGDGIHCMNKKSGVFIDMQHRHNLNRLSFSNIKSIVLDSRHNLWISMFREGLSCYNIYNDRLINFRHTNSDNSLINNDLRKIVLDEKGSGLWIAYQLNKAKISYLSFTNNNFVHFDLDSSKNSSYIFDIQKDEDNNLWAVTREKLYKFNTNTLRPEEIQLPSEIFLNAQSLYVDRKNNVWIGTLGKGLLKYETTNQEFVFMKEVLNSDIASIYSICADAHNCLWLGTDNGLVRYNIGENTFSKFDEIDGLQGQMYYPLSCMEGDDDNLYFGGTNGFSIINPSNVKYNVFKPKATISDFLIDNVSALPSLSDKINNIEEGTIVLKHNEANFGFRFSSNNYLNPQKNKFKYRLKEYDDRWITVDASNRVALYSKVPAGNYQFEILTANNDGVWNDVPTIVKVERQPSPWTSWQAYLVYLILMVAIAYLILYYYYDKQKLKKQLYLDALDKQKRDEIHQSQLNFFTNISHDFRTPLSLILAIIDNLKQEGVKEYYYRILHNNANRLLNLVNELMDFRSVENGKMQLQVEEVFINVLVKKVALDFEDYAQKHNIDFFITTDEQLDEQTVYVDQQIVEKVLMNLLNNAFKYTPNGGKIAIETYKNKNQFQSTHQNTYTSTSDFFDNKGFSIAVRDTGIGITKGSISNVFDRFYKVKTTNVDRHLGTGIGLALVKSLVLLHKGQIALSSTRNEGTDIVVIFSVNGLIYNSEEYLKVNKDVEQMIVSNEIPQTMDCNKSELQVTAYRDEQLPNGHKRILLVEDNDDLRELIANFLSNTYNIYQACNGIEAIDVLNDTEIDMIISDIMMPLMDGVALLQEVKSNINTSHIPFVLLTAKNKLESKIESAESGVDIFFEKPINLNLLILSIRNVFIQRQNIREYYSKNFYADSSKLSTNEKDNAFLKELINIIDANLNTPNVDVNYIASQLAMSRSKLYSKVKMITDKSIVEFILQYKLRKAARMLLEQDLPIQQIMELIGIRSQSYFTSVFKKEFGETPTSFVTKHTTTL